MPGQLLIAGQNGVSNSAGIKCTGPALEPRVGLAWKVLGSDKTVLRAGFGIYHDSAWSRARRVCGKIRRTSASPITSRGPAAPSQLVLRAALGQTPTGLSLSSGFATLLLRASSQLHGQFMPSRPTSSQAGFTNTTRTSNASYPAMFCHRRLCRLDRRPSAAIRQRPEYAEPVRLRHSPRLHAWLLARRTAVYTSLRIQHPLRQHHFSHG